MSIPEENPVEARINILEQREKQLTANIEALLRHVAIESRPCKACGVQLWFVRHQNDKIAPYTFDGTNHFINCPEAKK